MFDCKLPILKFTLLTLAAPTVLAQIRSTVQSLPDGDYRYRDSTAIDRPFREIQFRKQDRYITGSDFDKRTGKSYCFRGIPQHNNIINITVAIGNFPENSTANPMEISTGKPD
jgi:hypothetical protein